MADKLDKIAEGIDELTTIVMRQEYEIKAINEHLDRLADSVITHVKRSDAIQDLVVILKDQLSDLKVEHNLTKTLLESRIDSEKVSSDNKNQLLWNTVKTVIGTLSSIGAILLALHELGILNKIFQ